MSAHAGVRAGCRGCGVCCDLYGHTVHANGADLERWHAQGRSDLLRLVGPDGTLWWAGEPRARLESCPFFSWQGDRGGACAVHATKPAECRAYPTALHEFRCLMGEPFRAESGRAGGD